MSGRIRKILGSGPCFAFSAAAFVVFVLLALRPYAASAASYTPRNGDFDTSFFYTPRQALDRAAGFDTEGRFAYIRDRWTFDLAWPAVYGFFLASTAAFALQRAFPGAPRLRRWAFAAVAGGVALDYAENVAATVLVSAVPARPYGWAIAASAFTVLKWSVLGLAVAGVLGLLAAAVVRGFRSPGPGAAR